MQLGCLSGLREGSEKQVTKRSRNLKCKIPDGIVKTSRKFPRHVAQRFIFLADVNRKVR